MFNSVLKECSQQCSSRFTMRCRVPPPTEIRSAAFCRYAFDFISAAHRIALGLSYHIKDFPLVGMVILLELRSLGLFKVSLSACLEEQVWWEAISASRTRRGGTAQSKTDALPSCSLKPYKCVVYRQKQCSMPLKYRLAPTRIVDTAAMLSLFLCGT